MSAVCLPSIIDELTIRLSTNPNNQLTTQLQARLKELEQENVQKSTEIQRLRHEINTGVGEENSKGRVRVISPVPFMGRTMSPRDMNVMNNQFFPPSSPPRTNSTTTPMFHPPVPPSVPRVDDDKNEDDMETAEEDNNDSEAKTDQDLFSESEALARRLMQEESQRFMRQLEQAQVSSRMSLSHIAARLTRHKQTHTHIHTGTICFGYV